MHMREYNYGYGFVHMNAGDNISANALASDAAKTPVNIILAMNSW